MKDIGHWPSLALDEWRDTYATLHMWMQVVSLTTGPILCGERDRWPSSTGS